jgi:hypothetical protein
VKLIFLAAGGVRRRSSGRRPPCHPNGQPGDRGRQGHLQDVRRTSGTGGEQAIANALVANPLVSARLAHEIGLALTGMTLHANLVAQVQVTIDCAEARYDHVL